VTSGVDHEIAIIALENNLALCSFKFTTRSSGQNEWRLEYKSVLHLSSSLFPANIIVVESDAVGFPWTTPSKNRR
jgi:hypothetical protein